MAALGKGKRNKKSRRYNSMSHSCELFMFSIMMQRLKANARLVIMTAPCVDTAEN